MTTRRATIQGLAGGALLLATGRAFSQDNNSLITILVGAASGNEVTAQLIAEHLRGALGRPVVAIRKLGAGGRVALGELKRSPPDGRTLIFAASGPFVIYPNIYTKLDYDPVADFTPIAGLCWFDLAVATSPQIGVTDMRQLIAWIKSQGNDALYGVAPGAGSGSHFTGITIALATGVRMTPVYYNESATAISDLTTGRLPILITGTVALAQMHKAGKIHMLAVSGEQRSSLAPDVPTLKEAGVNVSLQFTGGLYGPAKMPKELVERLYNALMPMLSKADAREKLAVQGMVPSPMTGPQLAALLREERKRFEGLVKASGYVPEAL